MQGAVNRDFSLYLLKQAKFLRFRNNKILREIKNVDI